MYILRALHRSGFSERQARPQWLQEINNRKTPFFYQTVKEPLSGQRNGTGPPLPRRHSDVSLYEEVSVCWWKWKTPTVKQVNRRRVCGTWDCGSPLKAPQSAMSRQMFSISCQRQNTCWASDVADGGSTGSAGCFKRCKPEMVAKKLWFRPLNLEMLVNFGYRNRTQALPSFSRDMWEWRKQCEVHSGEFTFFSRAFFWNGQLETAVKYGKRDTTWVFFKWVFSLKFNGITCLQ